MQERYINRCHTFNYCILPTVPWWTSSRLGLAVLGFFGFVNVYALRFNLSVAIVCMVNATAVRLNSNGESDTANSTNSILANEHFTSSCGLISADANATLGREFEVLTPVLK